MNSIKFKNFSIANNFSKTIREKILLKTLILKSQKIRLYYLSKKILI